MIKEEQRLKMLQALAVIAFDTEKMNQTVELLEKERGIKTTPEEIMKHIDLLRSVRGT